MWELWPPKINTVYALTYLFQPSIVPALLSWHAVAYPASWTSDILSITLEQFPSSVFSVDPLNTANVYHDTSIARVQTPAKNKPQLNLAPQNNLSSGLNLHNSVCTERFNNFPPTYLHFLGNYFLWAQKGKFLRNLAAGVSAEFWFGRGLQNSCKFPWPQKFPSPYILFTWSSKCIIIWKEQTLPSKNVKNHVFINVFSLGMEPFPKKIHLVANCRKWSLSKAVLFKKKSRIKVNSNIFQQDPEWTKIFVKLAFFYQNFSKKFPLDKKLTKM